MALIPIPLPVLPPDTTSRFLTPCTPSLSPHNAPTTLERHPDSPPGSPPGVKNRVFHRVRERYESEVRSNISWTGPPLCHSTGKRSSGGDVGWVPGTRTGPCISKSSGSEAPPTQNLYKDVGDEDVY